VNLLLTMLLIGCSQPELQVSRTREAEPELVYARGREALTKAGTTQLRWGLTPFVSTTSVDAQYRPTLALISSRIGLPIEIVVGQDYADLEQQLLSGTIDVATMSPYAYVRAKEQAPGIQVFATHISGGSETYGGYIVAREESHVRTTEQVRGQSFAYVDPRSSSGWLFAASRLVDEGIHPVDDVQGMFYGSHAAVIKAVISGQAEVGATYGDALEDGRGRIPGAEKLRIVARTQRIPFDAYVVRSGLPREARDALQLALSQVSTRDTVGREALSTLMGLNGFMATTDSHYKSVRAVDAEVRKALLAAASGLPRVAPPPTPEPHEPQ
jgi:phosphate/phosphite/phosphonate ABC transporter binding protein